MNTTFQNILFEDYFEEDIIRHSSLFENFFSENLLFEEKHINKHIMPVAKDVTNLLLNIIDDYNLRSNWFDKTKKYYTFWHFTSNEDRNPANYENTDDIPDFFIKDYAGDNYHAIYFDFNDENRLRGKALAAVRAREVISSTNKKILVESIKARLKNDNIVIFVNIEVVRHMNFFEPEMKDYLESIIGHEIFHAFERYVLRYDDVLSHKKNTLYRGFLKNEFKLNNTDYSFIETLLYQMTPDEQRARINQLAILLENFSKDRSERLSDEIFNNHFVLRTMNGSPGELNMVDNKLDKRLAVSAILKTKKIGEVARLYSFYKNVLVFENTDELNLKYYLLIGYYLLEHKLLDFKKLNIKHLDAKNIFSKQNVEDALRNKSKIPELFEKVIKQSVYYNIVKNYLEYEKKIYETVDSYVLKIFPNLEFVEKEKYRRPLTIEEMNYLSEKMTIPDIPKLV